MTAYTERTLDKLSKKELIGITLSLQNKLEQYTNVKKSVVKKFSGKIKIRLQENSKPLAITHVEDFKKYFTDVDLTPSF